MDQKPITFNELPETLYQTREEVRELKKIVQTHLATSAKGLSKEADELLTPEETARFFKVSKVTVWDWTKRGILKKYTIGNQVRYLRSEIMAATTRKGGVSA